MTFFVMCYVERNIKPKSTPAIYKASTCCNLKPGIHDCTFKGIFFSRIILYRLIFFLFHQEFRVDDTLNINAWSSFKQMSCTTKTKCKVPAYQGVGSGGFKLPSFSLYKLRIFKASFALAKHLEACPY